MFTNLRKKIAAWLDPETAAKATKYEIMHRDLIDLKLWFSNIPEISKVIDWAFGSLHSQTNPGTDQNSTYKNYPSMAHFKEVIEHDYKRKTSNNPNVRY